MAFVLCCAVLLFPWALRMGGTIWWILAVLSLVSIGTLWPTILINNDKSKINVMTPEQNVSQEINFIQECIVELQEEQECIVEPQEEQECKVEPQEEQECIVKPQEDQECKVELQEEQECIVELQEEQECKVEPQEEQECKVEPQEEQECIVELQEEQECIVELQEEQECIVELQEEQECMVEPQEEQERIVELQENQGSIVEKQEALVEIDLTVENTTDHKSKGFQFPKEINIVMSIEELIDLGFKAKYADNFEKAASYFFRALSLDPMPDIAFYLILDCYWLWNNLGQRKFAQTQLDGYVKRYMPQFHSDLRHQFEAWMTKENFYKN